jgi:glycyl-tRNA synthetase beta chain
MGPEAWGLLLEVIMETLLLEIGTEEIPAGYIQPALESLAANLQKKLDDARIDHGAIATCGTPRRLMVEVAQVAPKQRLITEKVLGPPERIAFDEQGRPTMAAQKFAEKVGLAVRRLTVEASDKGRYLVAVTTQRGVSTPTVLKTILPEVILAIPFPKTMRWADMHIAFARPLHSVLALYGSRVISFALDGRIKSGRMAAGHMFMQPGRIKIQHPAEYRQQMRQAQVIVDIAERRQAVQQEIARAAAEVGGSVLPDEELVGIVTNLVEIPIATAGRFDELFLELPREILITAMREHQKYFAVVDRNGRLMPCFIAVNNTHTRDMALVATGHERVLRARLSDARFFFQADRQAALDDWVEQLKGVLFQAKLGSMHAKVKRVQALAEYLAETVRPELKSAAARAALLCKVDLVSEVVGEFPKLQGVMGRIYASLKDEPAAVARAIEEHYRPIYSGAALPETDLGALAAIADKMDSICGCFSVGLNPTGASDPYALRRQAIGVVQIMLTKGLAIALPDLIQCSLAPFATQTVTTGEETAASVTRFFQNRMAHMLAEEGFAKEVIAAVISVPIEDIPDVWNRVRALSALRIKPDFEPLAAAFKRVVNIIRKAEGPVAETVNPALFEHPSESALYDTYRHVVKQVTTCLARDDLNQALLEIASLRDGVDAFFDDVMVMVEEPAIRSNRLALLGKLAVLFNRFADFSKIST